MAVARNSPTAIHAKGHCHAIAADSAVPAKATQASRRNLREGANLARGLLMLKDYHCSRERIHPRCGAMNRLMKKNWPPMNADERRLKNRMLIGVHLRSSAAIGRFSATSESRANLYPGVGKVFEI
jgi:hypothetical protein